MDPEKRKLIEEEVLRYFERVLSTSMVNVVEAVMNKGIIGVHLALIGEVLGEMLSSGTLIVVGVYPHPYSRRDLDVRIQRDDLKHDSRSFM